MIRGLCGPIPLILLTTTFILVALAVTRGFTFGLDGSNVSISYPPPSPSVAPVSGSEPSQPVDRTNCSNSQPIKVMLWSDRDPFSDPYYLRPLKDVLIEMSDYGHGGRKGEVPHQQMMTKFAWQIIDRDRNTPEVLKYEMPLNQALQDLSEDRQPFFSYWDKGMYNSSVGIVKEMAHITLAKTKQMEDKYPDWAKFHFVPLDDGVLPDYVRFPDHVLAKRGSKYSTTYFSDMLRVNLMCEYGGFWADSSVFWHDDMPRSVYDSDFFAFKLWYIPAYSSSWFLHSKPHNPVFLWVRRIMFEYWRDHDTHHYFDFHLILEIVLQMLPEIKPYYDTMPYYGSGRAHSLHDILKTPFEEDTYNHALNQSWAFKLSNKASTISFQHKINERYQASLQYLKKATQIPG